jgi:hypothetical protein
VLVTIVVASSVFGSATAAADHVDQTRPSFMQWNMAGRVLNLGSVAPADALANSVLNRAPNLPLGLAVNEVCRTQFERLRQRLEPNGYVTTPFVVTRPNVIDCGGPGVPGDYGIAVFWLGQFDGYLQRTFGHNPETEQRKIVCGRSLSLALAVCATHLDNQRANAVLQAPEALDLVDSLNDCCQATFLGGDLNLEPREAVLDGWYASYDEADGNCRRAGTSDCRYVDTTDPSLGAKIDYLWFPRDTYRWAHDAYVFDSTWSDHHLYQGYHRTA